MALVEVLGSDGFRAIADALDAELQNRIRWQISRSEYDSRIDEAAHAVVDIFNKPYAEND